MDNGKTTIFMAEGMVVWGYRLGVYGLPECIEAGYRYGTETLGFSLLVLVILVCRGPLSPDPGCMFYP